MLNRRDFLTRAGGGSYEIVQYRNNAPATINDPELSRRVRPAMVRSAGEGKVIDTSPTMGGEDFAFFANQVPGFYFRLGVVAREADVPVTVVMNTGNAQRINQGKTSFNKAIACERRNEFGKAISL